MKKLILSLLVLQMPLFSSVLPHSERFFDSDLFLAWQKALYPKESAPISAADRRDYYQEKFGKIREGNESSFDYFTKPKLLESYGKAFDELFQNNLAQIKQVNSFDFADIMLNFYEKSLENPDYVGPDKSHKVDYYLAGNVPYHLFDFGKAKILRMPNPTGDDHAINPEFTHYLEELKNKKQTHLYINAMSSLSGENEAKKVQAVQNLQSSTITVVTFDKNSPFYWQSGEFENIDEAEEFKELFAQKLLSKSETNYWPDSLQTRFWEKKVRAVINFVHYKYFHNEKILNVYDRQDLIEIVYVELIKSLMSNLKPDIVNVTCKQSIDRGPSILALLYLERQLQANGKLSGGDVRDIASLLIVQPIIMRNRTAHAYRIGRFISAAVRILGESPFNLVM